MRCQELPSLSLQTNPFGVWRKPLYPLSLFMDPFSTIWLSLHHMLLKLATSSFWGTLIKLWVSIWKKNCNTKSPNFHRLVVGDLHLFYWQPIFCHIVANSLVWIYDLSCQIVSHNCYTQEFRNCLSFNIGILGAIVTEKYKPVQGDTCGGTHRSSLKYDRHNVKWHGQDALLHWMKLLPISHATWRYH
jgi:hypothetical protein